MGARFDYMYPIMKSRIHDGQIEIIDIDGKLYKVPITTKYNFDWDDANFVDAVYIKHIDKENNRAIVCRKDGSYSVWRLTDNLLIDYGKFNREIFMSNIDSYDLIGYAKYVDKLYQVYIGNKHNYVFLTVPETFNCRKMLKVKKRPTNCNPLTAYVKSQEPTDVVLDIFIYNGIERLDWREYFEEISSN